jgi:hypothetical protein
MTGTLYEALKRMLTIREGFVVRNFDGSAKGDGQASWVIGRICRRAVPIVTGTRCDTRSEPRRSIRREPVAIANVDGSQADRRCVREAAEGELNHDLRILKMLGWQK